MMTECFSLFEKTGHFIGGAEGWGGERTVYSQSLHSEHCIVIEMGSVQSLDLDSEKPKF